jgi:hypothetical protein
VEKLLDKNYQVVVLKAPYGLMSNWSARNTFGEICQLKITGYAKEYPAGILPFDGSDFIASHVALCEKTNTGLVPVMAFKAVTLADCDHHRVNFPILGMVKSPDNTSRHVAYFEEMLRSYRESGRSHKLAYNGSFTVHPDARADQNFTRYMWDLVFFMISAHYITEEIDQVVAVCSTQFKVDVKKTTRGWRYCEPGGNRLEAYRCFSLFDTNFIPMELKDIVANCQVHFDRFRSLWEARQVYEVSREIRKAA